MILKISDVATSLASSDTKLGPADGCYFVKINDIPEGVSSGQVILLFEYTAKKAMERGKYEFQFSELCPISGIDLNWRVEPSVKRTSQ